MRAYCCGKVRFGDTVSTFLNDAILYEVGPKSPEALTPSYTRDPDRYRTSNR